MKKILFSAYKMDLGGIETALVTLLKSIYNKYEITLVLEEKEGIFLKEIPDNIKIITYKPSKIKNVFFRKVSNFFKQLIFKVKYKNKFDFSACYATYSYPASFVARCASKNSCLWVHNDYMNFYNNDKKVYKSFFEKLKAEDYRKIVFVSNHDKDVFIKEMPEFKEKCVFCNNLIDYKKIQQKSNEPVNDLEREPNIITFINMGRHDEKQKKLSRIIKATKRLNDEGYIFRVIFVGDGNDSLEYKKQAQDITNIKFLGTKKNPYPYLKMADVLLMSSDFEGYPVVFIESEILEKPIITTNVSDSMKDIQNKFGIVVEKSENGVYLGMKEFLEKGFNTKKFNAEKFNQDILKKVEELIGG